MEDPIFIAYTAEKEESSLWQTEEIYVNSKILTQTKEKTIRFFLKNEVIKAQAFYLQHRLSFLCAGKKWKVKLAVLGMAWAGLAWQWRDPGCVGAGITACSYLIL